LSDSKVASLLVKELLEAGEVCGSLQFLWLSFLRVEFKFFRVGIKI